MATAKIRVGISGWRYGGWRGVFYPDDLRQRDELHYASRHVSVIEINGTFYSMQRPQSFLQWKDETPLHFLFAVKGSRYITHMLKLNGVRPALANFFAQGVLALGPKLGPILWQLPPGLGFHADKLEAFLQMLPRTAEQAATLALEHDHRIKVEPYLESHGVAPLRYAMEVRHNTFCCEDYLAILRKYNIANVVSDSAGRFPVINDVTADFVYVRLHGHEHLYSGGYGEQLLHTWATRARAWQKGQNAPDVPLTHPTQKPPRRQRDVFIFFDNDERGAVIKISPDHRIATCDARGVTSFSRPLTGRKDPAEDTYILYSMILQAGLMQDGLSLEAAEEDADRLACVG